MTTIRSIISLKMKKYKHDTLINRHRYRYSKSHLSLYIAIFSLILFIVYLAVINHVLGLAENNNNPTEFNVTANDHDSSTPLSSSSSFIPTLRNKKILIELTTVGMRQFSHLETVLDSIRDLCECGAQVSLHITTTTCDQSLKLSRCQPASFEKDKGFPKNYPSDIISHLNERLRCRDVDGSIDTNIHIKSPEWGKQLVDFHRSIFYDNINEGYDVFIHSEEDQLVRPTNVIAFLDEIEKVRSLVGNERLSDYSIGFVRYENEMSRDDKRRVVWEFEWEKNNFGSLLVNHSGLDGKYFTTPGWHHQGMFMAIKEQLVDWTKRKPDCHFNRIEMRSGYHRERISGAIDLYDEEYCNVTQLIPLDSFEDLLIHHLPDQNNVRQPNNIESLNNLHKMRMNAILTNDKNKKLWVDEKGVYDGIKMFIDEKVKPLQQNITEYTEYVSRGGMLPYTNFDNDDNNYEYIEQEIEWEESSEEKE